MEKELRSALGLSTRARAKRVVKEFLASGILVQAPNGQRPVCARAGAHDLRKGLTSQHSFARRGAHRMRFADLAMRRHFENSVERSACVEMHRRRALALEAQYGADLRCIMYEITVHFLKGEAWQKANQTMTFAFKNAMLDFKAIRAAARIVDFVVDNDHLPAEVREHMIRLLRECLEDTASMMRLAAEDLEVAILQQVRGTERRDSRLYDISVSDRVDRHLRLIEDHYVFTLEQRYESVDAGTMVHFLNLFFSAVQNSLPVDATCPEEGGFKGVWHWPCGANTVTPDAVKIY